MTANNRHAPRDESDGSAGEVNLTPMLDVVFILLIFFIVTASFLKETGVDVYAPPGGVSVDREAESIAIQVLVGGIFRINGRSVTHASVLPSIRQLRTEMPDAPVAVLVAPQSQLGDLVHAVDSVRRTGLSSVAVTALEPTQSF